jgi:hypothetical protein
MGHSSQGIVKDQKGQEQPADKERAQTVQKTKPDRSVSREATRKTKPAEGDENSG